MSKKHKNINRKGRNKYNGEQFLKLPYSLLTSLQFLSLNGSDVKVLLEISSRHNGYNNSRISAGYKDLSSKLMLSKSTVQRSLKNLEITGFIKCRKKGVFMGRRASEWEVTFLSCEGMPPSNEWGQTKPLKRKRKPRIKPLEEELRENHG